METRKNQNPVFLTLCAEAKQELVGHLIPFWLGMRDEERGGFLGYVSYDLVPDARAEKGCILNSRITWFFANAYTLYRQGEITEKECLAAGFCGEELRRAAECGYAFLKNYCLDRENGGIYWSLNCDGTPSDMTKHTYNQAFGIYALASYYEAVGDVEALASAEQLFALIEEKCRDENGYLEAFTRDFRPASNEKLSENGVLADRTMNTLLHVFEAYTELYRVIKKLPEKRALAQKVKTCLCLQLDVFADKVYNPALHRQEVFFDAEYRSLLDLHSYGHDIETAWLVDRGTQVLGDEAYERKMNPITADLTKNIYGTAFDGHSLANECERGVVDETRVWWVQAETVVGFVNGCEKMPAHTEYLDAAAAQWEFIKRYVIDGRAGSEWYWEVDQSGVPIAGRPIVEPWKCPYHNGRMCMELIRRQRGGLHA